MDIISGEIIHSRSFKSATGYENKTAVVVGLGNSGGDAAVELRFECFSKNQSFKI
jgi:dimethylaniline monooxygenase (N-oxide forming)